MTKTYSPDAMRILANIAADTYCHDCGVSAGDDHLEPCSQYGMPYLQGKRVIELHAVDYVGTVVRDTGNHCVTVQWDAPYPLHAQHWGGITELSRHRLTILGEA